MKKIICVLLTVVMLLGAMAVIPVSAVTAVAETTERSEKTDVVTAGSVTDPLGVKQFTERLREMAERIESKTIDGLSRAENRLIRYPWLYSSVVAGRTTSVKDQGRYGTCWAFGFTSAAEASLLTKYGVEYNLSELQLVYYLYQDKIDPLGYASGDGAELVGMSIFDGAIPETAFWALAGWVNGAEETEDSPLWYDWQNCESAARGELDGEYANGFDVAHLRNGYIIPYSTSRSSLDAIKEAVMEYGAVACAYYHDWNYYDAENSSYCSTINGTNHVISIVGWNDYYSRYRFSDNCIPPRDGAWLVKNSWGEDWGTARPSTDGDALPWRSGSEGYFWLSYYDLSVLSEGKAYVFDFVSDIDPDGGFYQYNYQYDGGCGNEGKGVLSGEKICSVYTVKGLTCEKESLEAVGLGIASANTSGTVSIYVDPEEGDPLSGTLSAQVPFEVTYAGFYTVELDEPIILNRGQSYAVVLEFDRDAVIFVDKSVVYSPMYIHASTEGEKTYRISSQNAVSSIADEGYTPRIKAYTNDVEGYEATGRATVTYDANGGVGTPASQIKSPGMDLILQFQKPTRSGFRFAGWATDSGATVAEYFPGDTYTEDVDLVLYAVWIPVQTTALIASEDLVVLYSGGSSKKITVRPDQPDATVDWEVVGFQQDIDSDGMLFYCNALFRIYLPAEYNGNKFVLYANADAIGGLYSMVIRDRISGLSVEIVVDVQQIVANLGYRTIRTAIPLPGGLSIPVYTTELIPVMTGTTVSKVEYSIDGLFWKTGTEVSLLIPLNRIYVRVTDAQQNLHYFTVNVNNG